MPMINIEDAYILGETGAEVDKVTGLFTKDEDTTSGEKAFAQLNIGASGGGGGGENLLDNPFFTAGNVVNQRGFSSSSAEGYTVDRWKLLRTNIITATLGNDGMTISKNTTGYAFFSQYIGRAIDLEATYTLSVMTSDGQVYSATRKFVNGTSSETYVSIGGMNVGFGLYGKDTTPHAALYFGTSQTGSLTVKAIKLELGSVSTLANDAPPNYAEELAKCQRYLMVYKFPGSVGAIGFAYAHTTTNATAVITLPVPMRATPTISVVNSIALQQGTVRYNLTSPDNIVLNGNVLTFSSPYTVVSGTAAAGTVGALLLRENAILTISAEL